MSMNPDCDRCPMEDAENVLCTECLQKAKEETRVEERNKVVNHMIRLSENGVITKLIATRIADELRQGKHL